MTAEELEALVWEEIDGVLTPADRERLEAYIAEHPEAGQRRADLEDFARFLDEVKELEPPSELQQRIRQALADRRPPTRRGEIRPRAMPARTRPAAVRLGYLAAGVLVGALGYHLASTIRETTSPVDETQLYGAMDRALPQAAVPGIGRSGLAIPLAGLPASLELTRAGSVVSASVRLDLDDPIDVSFQSLGGTLQLQGSHQAGTSVIGLTVGRDRLTVAMQGQGELRFDLVVEPSLDPILWVTITAGSETIAVRGVKFSEIPEIARSGANFDQPGG